MSDSSMLYPLSMMVLALSVVPAVKLCLKPVLWSKYRDAGLFIVAALTAYAVLIAITWQNFRWLLPYAAVFAAILMVYFWWRARPGYGVNRGLPHGSLSMVRSLQSVNDPDFYLEQGAKFAQIFKMSQFHRPTLCITSIDKGLDLIRNNEVKLTPPSLQFDRFIPRRFIRYMGQEDHSHYRQILKKVFHPGIIDANKNLIQTAAAVHIRRMSDVSNQGPGVHPMIFMRDFTYDVLPAVFFGLEPGSEEIKQLQSHYHRLDKYNLQNRYPDDIEDILLEMEVIIRSSAEKLSGAGHMVQRSSFLQELVNDDPDAINDITLRRNLIYLMGNGRSDVTGLIVWVWYFLAQNPQWLEKVKLEAEPGNFVNWRRLDCTVDRIIAETLRMEQSEYIYREVLDEVEWNGLRIPKGWLVRVCTHEGHRDASLFEHPDEFNPDRFMSKKFMPTEYSPLGLGHHSCLGIHLIFTIVRYLVLHLASEYQVEMVNAGKRSTGGKHWLHWRRDDAFAVRVNPS